MGSRHLGFTAPDDAGLEAARLIKPATVTSAVSGMLACHQPRSGHRHKKIRHENYAKFLNVKNGVGVVFEAYVFGSPAASLSVSLRSVPEGARGQGHRHRGGSTFTGQQGYLSQQQVNIYRTRNWRQRSAGNNPSINMKFCYLQQSDFGFTIFPNDRDQIYHFYHFIFYQMWL